MAVLSCHAWGRPFEPGSAPFDEPLRARCVGPHPARTTSPVIMRIIGGRCQRHRLSTPKGRGTSATTDRSREAIFNLLATRLDLNGAWVLDLFSGSGALGLEALSRGAEFAAFIETDGRAMAVARDNAESLGIDEACEFVRMDAIAYLKRYAGRAYDLVLADPPYNLPYFPLLPEMVLHTLTANGVYCLEHDARVSPGQHPNLETSRRYGKSVLAVYHAEPVSEDHPE